MCNANFSSFEMVLPQKWLWHRELAASQEKKIIIMGVYLANLQQPLPSEEKLCEFYFPFGKKKHSSQLN